MRFPAKWLWLIGALCSQVQASPRFSFHVIGDEPSGWPELLASMGLTSGTGGGASVIVADIVDAKANAVAEKIVSAGGKAIAKTVDVSDSGQVQALIDDVVTRFGRLDVLYHCAADVAFVNTQDRVLTELSEAVWDRKKKDGEADQKKATPTPEGAAG